VCDEPRREFYAHMDAANVDLKGFTDGFYRRLAKGHLQPVLETLEHLAQETDVWFELTTLVIPGWNDGDRELDAMTRWVVEHLGPDVPMHFTAFHPDFRMLDVPPTPGGTLTRAREIARRNGVRYAYTGNVHDRDGGTTFCHGCGRAVIERDWYVLREWRLTPEGGCRYCGTPCAGVFDRSPDDWGARRMPVRIGR
jgi:pyruvate formate lyase activating enzyme